MGTAEALFIAWALAQQAVLILHFVLRERLVSAYGSRVESLVYALGVPAGLVSLTMLLEGKSWPFWLGGLMLLAWAFFGWLADDRLKLSQSRPVAWRVKVPYLMLYLAAALLYWLPLGLVNRTLWATYTPLLLLSSAHLVCKTLRAVEKPLTLIGRLCKI